MLPFKNIGIFGEYEERVEKRAKNMAAHYALQKFIESMGDYPDTDDPAVQEMIDKLWEEIIQTINKVRDENDQ
jgi:hypothetical protein